MSPPPPTCLRDVRAAAVHELQRAGVDDAGAVADFVLADLLHLPRLRLRLEPDRILTASQSAALAERLQRLAHHEPLAHVLGHAEFLGRRFRSDRRALVPRPETELLVESALALIAGTGPRRVADAGTGSGCIAVSLALLRPAWDVWATDLSPDALALAQANAVLHGVAERIHWFQCNLLEGLPEGAFDLVISNPPYVPSAEINHLAPNVREHDPRLALDGGSDGLDVIRALVPQARSVLRAGGWLVMEVGEDQAPEVQRLLTAEDWVEAGILRDLSGIDRFVRAQRR